MKITVTDSDVNSLDVETIVFGVFENETTFPQKLRAIDAKLNGAVTELVKSGEIKGKLNEFTRVYGLKRISARSIVVAGLGPREKFNEEKLRNLAANICRELDKAGVKSIAFALFDYIKHSISESIASRCVVEGAILGLYKFSKYFTREKNVNRLDSMVVCVDESTKSLDEIKHACKLGKEIAEATNFTRDLVNEPANNMTPKDVARVARQVATKYGLELEVWEEPDIAKAGMNAFLSVAKGSNEKPRFIVLKYNGRPDSQDFIALVGKCITFDSGGISLKPSENMKEMKGDMAGGAAVLGTMQAIAKLKLRANIMAIMAATENLPSGSATRPGDVVKASNGKTIEIVNTDAEGRLTLADALSYAVKQKSRLIIDFATLTGACQIALGNICSGGFTNNQKLLDILIEAGHKAGECIWPMPMYEEYKEQNKSDIADIKNTGNRYGGAITAALFLSEFVDDIPWVHVDIAGTAMSDKDRGYIVKGATGVGVRTLVNFIEEYAKKGISL